ncbi:MAG: glycosyltransferase [Nitrospirales bacterium]|nr:glycosyltransferase [Nitrospirales bacterium]
MQKIAIIQRKIPHYRTAFFAKLNVQAKEAGLDITVYTGLAPEGGASCGFRFKVLSEKLLTGQENGPYWLEGLTRASRGSDIIIAPQELQCLNIPYLWVRRKTLCRHWIWWGHGYNFKAKAGRNWLASLKDAMKHFMTKRGDGLITYTASGKEYWRRRGMAADWVMPYFNTLDVEGLREAGAQVTEETLVQVRRQLGLEGKRVLLFSGSLYPEKEVDFLLKTFALLQSSHPNVALLILGDGSERNRLEELRDALNLQHVHFLGEDNDPVHTGVYFKLADLFVLPGAVGLAIVHGFAYGLPLVTTEQGFHGPEIEYLSNENGIKTAHDTQTYANEISIILRFPNRIAALQAGARHQGDQLTLAGSAQRFVKAVQLFLEQV